MQGLSVPKKLPKCRFFAISARKRLARAKARTSRNVFIYFNQKAKFENATEVFASPAAVLIVTKYLTFVISTCQS